MKSKKKLRPVKKQNHQKAPLAKNGYFGSYQKNLDVMKLLISDPDFQTDIQHARQKLEIPKNGLKTEQGFLEYVAGTNVREGTWYEAFLKKSDVVLLSPEFKQKIHTVWEKEKNGLLSNAEADEESRILHLEIPLNYLNHIPRFLSEKYKIPGNFTDCIKRYLMFGIVEAPPLNYSFSQHLEGPKFRHAPYLTINIFAQITKDEAVGLAKWIKIMGDELPQYKPLKDIERKLTIEQWYRERHTDFDHATGQPFKTTASDIAQTVLGSSKKKGKVYEAVREIRDLRKKRFGKSEE